MKKIFKDTNKNKAISHNRIICEACKGYLRFWYSEDKDTCHRVKLFDTDVYSGSVHHLFKSKGRPEKTRGYSMKIHQLYDLAKTDNPKVNQVMRQIPVKLREELNKRERYCLAHAYSKKAYVSKTVLDQEQYYFGGRVA